MLSVQILKLRLKRGWSQQQLANVSGLSGRTIQRIESGHAPSMETLKCLAAVFDVEYSTLNPENPMDTAINPQEIEEQNAFREVARLKAFYVHLLQYVVINLGLNAFNFLVPQQTIWAPFVASFWGLGLIVHALTVFKLHSFLGPQWEKRQVEKRLGRPLS